MAASFPVCRPGNEFRSDFVLEPRVSLGCLYRLTTNQSSLTTSLQSPPDWREILTYFRGSELQNYFTKILEDDLTVRSSLQDVNFAIM